MNPPDTQSPSLPHSGLPLVLASASPRRRQLLRGIGIPIEVFPVGAEETPLPGEDGPRSALRLAREKAQIAAAARPRQAILAADTVVLIESQILGKPRTIDEAREMLGLLSGRWHRVVTGVALRLPSGAILSESSATEVRFSPLSAQEIEAYIATPEPYDKAGAYAIQGVAGWFIEEIRGSASNVIGLPLEVVRRLLLRAGLPGPSLTPLPDPK